MTDDISLIFCKMGIRHDRLLLGVRFVVIPTLPEILSCLLVTFDGALQVEFTNQKAKQKDENEKIKPFSVKLQYGFISCKDYLVPERRWEIRSAFLGTKI